MRCPLAALLLLAACGSVPPSDQPDAAPDSSGPSHVLADQEDEVAGNQLHIIYAVPSDGADRNLDLNGTLRRSVAAWSSWFAGQALGPRLRIDTFAGFPDITFVRLPRTDAVYAAEGPMIRDRIEQDLSNLKLINLAKAYAVYYDGTAVACGNGPYPPTLIGRVAVTYLDGLPGATTPCRANPVGASAETPGYIEFVMLHELLHTLGASAACSPNQAGNGHVGDDPTDLMYAGALPWRPAKLDVGNDDYWRHASNGCLDLINSAFLDPLPAMAQLPPGW